MLGQASCLFAAGVDLRLFARKLPRGGRGEGGRRPGKGKNSQLHLHNRALYRRSLGHKQTDKQGEPARRDNRAGGGGGRLFGVARMFSNEQPPVAADGWLHLCSRACGSKNSFPEPLWELPVTMAAAADASQTPGSQPARRTGSNWPKLSFVVNQSKRERRANGPSRVIIIIFLRGLG